ncbi:MAG: DUF1566 domain-containing protein [Desulfobulbaceae bacterium]|nr:DUF1566 domain-containing protein [Desulfobulbaceae bacterium]
MGLANMLDLKDTTGFFIDWEITPSYTFTMFESWGGRNGERQRSNDEKFYYFYVDGWESPFGLYLMERGVKHARLLARINAPQALIDACVADEGRSASLDKSYAVNRAMRQWLLENIVNNTNPELVTPLFRPVKTVEMLGLGLPPVGTIPADLQTRKVRRDKGVFTDEEVAELIRTHNYFDSQLNGSGGVESFLVDNGDNTTATDLVSGVTWQLDGCDLTSIKKVRLYIDELNRCNFAGHHDWRLPTLDEALSLMKPEKNDKGLHLHQAFSREQPFIFVADERRPGGYWFVDYKQGAAFWASGTIPGGFGRACRTA